MHRAKVRGVLSVAVACWLLACGSPNTTNSPTSRPGATSPGVVPTLTSAPSMTSEPAPTHLVGGEIPEHGWERIGELPGGGYGRPLRWWFSAGYLVLGGVEAGDDHLPTVWFSPDAVTWEPTTWEQLVTPCPGWVPRPDLTLISGWAAGGVAMLIGSEHVLDGPRCGDQRLVIWQTGDGVVWTKNTVVGPDGEITGHPQGIWSTPAGWEVAIQDEDETTWLWRSSDAVVWERVSEILEGPDWLGITVANDGTRVVNTSGALLLSRDGREWRRVSMPLEAATAEGGPPTIMEVVAPEWSDPFWLVVTLDTFGDTVSTVWKTRDFRTWENARFPMPGLASIAYLTDGIVARGIVPCIDTGTECPSSDPQYFRSADGLTWDPMHASAGPEIFIQGNGGDIGFGQAADGGDQSSVWRLVSYDEDEAYLLAGLRADARRACAPRRVDLPEGAIAGVECDPGEAPIDRVGVYRFRTTEAMLQTYLARLADEGVRPGTGDCPASGGDQAYGRDGADGSTARIGCFVNRFGNANYRLTVPEGKVNVGVLGTTTDMRRLDAWIRRDGEGSPASPTVWRVPA